MDTLQRTTETLTSAERALATLASEAAKESNYEAASCLLDLAREVRGLSAKAQLRLGESSDESADVSSRNGPVASAHPSKTRRSKKSVYPQFLRQGETLVKIAWSPSEKAEYEHKSPKKVVVLLAAAIGKAGANGRRFAMDRVIPLIDPADGSRIPDYQVYLCLAWFRELGFVIQHGRQGYSLASKAPIEPVIETHWAALSSR